jgi:hypothetical protein
MKLRSASRKGGVPHDRYPVSPLPWQTFPLSWLLSIIIEELSHPKRVDGETCESGRVIYEVLPDSSDCRIVTVVY